MTEWTLWWCHSCKRYIQHNNNLSRLIGTCHSSFWAPQHLKAFLLLAQSKPLTIIYLFMQTQPPQPSVAASLPTLWLLYQSRFTLDTHIRTLTPSLFGTLPIHTLFICSKFINPIQLSFIQLLFTSLVRTTSPQNWPLPALLRSPDPVLSFPNFELLTSLQFHKV